MDHIRGIGTTFRVSFFLRKYYDPVAINRKQNLLMSIHRKKESQDRLIDCANSMRSVGDRWRKRRHRKDPIYPDRQEKTLLSIGLRPPIPPKTTVVCFFSFNCTWPKRLSIQYFQVPRNNFRVRKQFDIMISEKRFVL